MCVHANVKTYRSNLSDLPEEAVWTETRNEFLTYNFCVGFGHIAT